MRIKGLLGNIYFIFMLLCTAIYICLFYYNAHLTQPITFIIPLIFFIPFLLFIYALEKPAKQNKILPIIFIFIVLVKLLKAISVICLGSVCEILERIDILYDPFAITFLFFLLDFFKSQKS